MSFTTVSSQIQLIMSMSGDSLGWQEKVYLPQANIPDALVVAKRIVGFRLNCLPKALQLDFARLTTIGAPRDGTSVLTSYPAVGLYNDGSSVDEADFTPNLVTDAVRIRLETAEGPFSMRFLRGVPDVKIVADALASAITSVTTIPADPSTVVATTTAWEVMVAQYLFAVKTLTKFFRIRLSGDVKVMETADISQVIVRGVEYKSTGRPFGLRRGRATPR